MANEHGIIGLGIEFAIGLIHQLEAGQGHPALEADWGVEGHALRGDDTNGIHFVHLPFKNKKPSRRCFRADWVALALAGFIERPQADSFKSALWSGS